MKRFLAARHGFFSLASVVCFATLTVIEKEHRWVSITFGTLYALLSIAFFLDQLPREPRTPKDLLEDATPFPPPPPPSV